MANKKNEERIVEIARKSIYGFNDFTKISDDKQECPDFIYRKGNQIMGVEHIEIPLLSTENGETEKIYTSQMRKLYNKFKDNCDSHYKEIVDCINMRINYKLDAYTCFTYNQFLYNCANHLGYTTSNKQKGRKHNATRYIKSLKKDYPHNIITITFVLDICYNINDISYFQYRESLDKQFHTQRYLDFPFTYLFITLLGQIKNVNDFYIVWHPHNEYCNKKYVRCYRLHYDKYVFKERESNISKIFWDFDMPKKLKNSIIELKLE